MITAHFNARLPCTRPFFPQNSHLIQPRPVVQFSPCFPTSSPSLATYTQDSTTAESSEKLLTSDGDCIPSHFSKSLNRHHHLFLFFPCRRNLPSSPTSLSLIAHPRSLAENPTKHAFSQHGHTDDVNSSPRADWNASCPPTVLMNEATRSACMPSYYSHVRQSNSCVNLCGIHNGLANDVTRSPQK